MTNITAETFTSARLTLRATRWGSPTAQSIVLLLHGLGFHRFEYAELGPLLAQQARCACFAFDFRGHGHSDGPRGRWQLADLVADAQAAIDHLAANHAEAPAPVRIGVFGNSLGALVGLRLAAADARIHSVVASGCPTRVADFAASPGRATLLTALTQLDRLIPLRISVNWFIPYRHILHDPALRRRVAADPLVADARRFAPSTYRDMLAWTALDVAARINVPVLVLAGTADRFQPLSQSTMLAAALPAATTELRLLDTGHVPNLEAPDLIVPILTRWFSKTLEPTKPRLQP
jgi:pimeloyl-ACP methyl ester carboxylesterase